MAHAGERAAKPEIDQLKIGTDARVALEKIKADLLQGQLDLTTRIQLMKDKTSSAELIAQIQSLTKRTDSSLKRQTELEKELIKISAGERSSSTTK